MLTLKVVTVDRDAYSETQLVYGERIIHSERETDSSKDEYLVGMIVIGSLINPYVTFTLI